MTQTSTTRRSFLKAGALIATPIAAGGSSAALADGGLKARLTELEDAAALRRLHQAWLRQVNAGVVDAVAKLAGPVSGIVAEADPEAQSIRVAADGQRATGRFACSVETETELEADCTFAQMARLQGTGIVRSIAPQTLKVDYLRTPDGWAVARAELSAA